MSEDSALIGTIQISPATNTITKVQTLILMVEDNPVIPKDPNGTSIFILLQIIDWRNRLPLTQHMSVAHHTEGKLN